MSLFKTKGQVVAYWHKDFLGSLFSSLVNEGTWKRGYHQNCEETHRFSVFSFFVSFRFIQIPNLHNHEPRDLFNQAQAQVCTKTKYNISMWSIDHNCAPHTKTPVHTR